MIEGLPKFISIHIPKCGGNTFGKIIHSIYGDRHCIISDDGLSPIPDVFSEEIYPQEWKTVNVIHGHFDYAKYTHFPLITWVRDPFDRLVSAYYYSLRKGRGGLIGSYVKEKHWDIYQFAEFLPNQQTLYIGEKVKRYIFIGLIEHYSQSIKRFEKIMGLKVPEYKHENRGKFPSQEKLDKIDRERIEFYIRKDRIVYNEILTNWGF